MMKVRFQLAYWELKLERKISVGLNDPGLFFLCQINHFTPQSDGIYNFTLEMHVKVHN